MVRTLKLGALALALALVAGACSSSPEEAVSGNISLQAFGDPAEIAAYQALIDAFESQVPDVTVDLIGVPKQGDHMTKLTTAFAAGDAPDLFLINYRRFGQFAGKDVLEPLGARLDASKRLKRGDFYAQPLDAFTHSGALQCVPQNISSLVVYYNTDLFKRFGVDAPKEDWTLDDFVRTAKALTKDTDGDGKVDVYGVGTEPTLIRLAPFVWTTGGELVDDTDNPTGFALDSDKALAGISFFGDLVNGFKVAPPQQEAESEDLESRFANGRLAMLLDSRRAVPTLREIEGLEFDVAPLPRQEQAVSVLHSDAYCMAKSSTNRDAAWRFIEFALSNDGAPILARAGRTVPSNKTVAESDAFLDPSRKPASSRVFLDAIPTMRRVPNIPSWNEIEKKSDRIIEEWYYEGEPPDELVAELKAATAGLFSG